MKGFLEWFKSSSKMKRWIFLILLGAVSIGYSIAKILVTNKLEGINDLLIIILGFVLGFLAIVIGLVYMQKRTLEILVKKTDTREEENLKSLIFNRKVYSQGPKIVVIGGGTGLNAVLRGLKNYTDNLTAVVTVSDYGEKSTDSRTLLKTLPLEDIKESLIALSSNEEEMGALLNYKFDSGKLQSLSYGDIYLLAMQNVYKDFSKSVKESSEVLNMTGKVLPVTMEEMKICAELEDGTVIQNRSEIPDIVNQKSSKINRIFINPSNCRVAPGVAEAIEEADAVIIGPGNLYTNVIPNLLVKGVARAIKNCKGFKIYISNIMTEPGQTYNYSLSDHIKAIIDHVGEGVVDYCIYDTGEVVPEFIRKYNMEGSELVEQDISKAKSMGVHLIKRDLATVTDDHIRHNPDAIAASIIELICEDLKFKNMQNNPEYIILNDQLQTKKRSNRRKKRLKEDGTVNNNISKDKNGSRFFNKYHERIDSIKQSAEKSKQKNKKRKDVQNIAKRVDNMRKAENTFEGRESNVAGIIRKSLNEEFAMTSMESKSKANVQVDSKVDSKAKAKVNAKVDAKVNTKVNSEAIKGNTVKPTQEFVARRRGRPRKNVEE